MQRCSISSWTGSLFRSFDPSREQYTVNLQLGTVEAPVISATRADYGASVSVSQAGGVPGTATVTVTAEDGVTTKTYTVNFTSEGTDEIIDLAAPSEFSPGDTITVSVSYTATTSRDIQVLLKDMNDNVTKYGESRVTVPMGARTEDVEVIVASNTPLATDTYKISVNLLPVGGSFAEVLDIMKIYDLDVVSPYSSDASLSSLTVNDIPVPGFDPGTLSYDIELQAGTVDVPVVGARESGRECHCSYNRRRKPARDHHRAGNRGRQCNHADLYRELHSGHPGCDH